MQCVAELLQCVFELNLELHTLRGLRVLQYVADKGITVLQVHCSYVLQQQLTLSAFLGWRIPNVLDYADYAYNESFD